MNPQALRRITLLLATTCAVFAAILAIATPAHALDVGGGTAGEPGAGSCNLSYAIAMDHYQGFIGDVIVSEPNQPNFAQCSNNGAAYGSFTNFMQSSGGTTKDKAARAAAQPCWDNRSKMLVDFWLVNRNDPAGGGHYQWEYFPGNGDTNQIWQDRIWSWYRGSNGGDDFYLTGNDGKTQYLGSAIRDAALKWVNGNGPLIIMACVWEGQVQPAQKCPQDDNSLPTSNPLHWVRSGRSNVTIPASYNTDAERGDYCFFRHDTASHTRNFVWSGTTPGTVYDYDWQCVVSQGTTTHAGPTAFQPQAPDVVYTPLGQDMQQAAANNTDVTPAQISADDPKKDSADRCHSTLTSNNQTWLAEGDVMNVQQFTQRAAVDHDWVRTVPQSCNNSRDWDFQYDGTGSDATMTAGAWTPPCDPNAGRTASGWSDSGALQNTSDTYYLTTQTPELTGLWQTLSEHANSGSSSALGHADALASNNRAEAGVRIVRCGTSAAQCASRGVPNAQPCPNGFYCGAVPTYSGTTITDLTNGDPNHHWSGSAVTDAITPSDGSSPAAHLVWGAGATDPEGTDQVGFFDKEAAYDGVRKPTRGSRAFQTQFRDNTPRPYLTDLYVPQAEGVVHGDYGTALSTSVSRWTLGTPLPGNVTNAGTFSMQSGDGQQFFSASTAGAPVEKDWSVTTGAAQAWGQVTGQVTSFLTAANWPSDAGKPQAFSVKWEFAPTVDNTIPTTVGYGAGGAPAYTTSVVGVPIQGKVQNVSSGAATSPALFNEQELNTGSGTTNGLDGVMYWGTSLDANNDWTQRPDQYSGYYNGLRFVRGTHE